MIKLQITDKTISLYKETLFTTLLPRRYFKLFGLNRSGKDIQENKLKEFYETIIKEKNLSLDGKAFKLKDILFAQYETIEMIIEENQNIQYNEIEKNIANRIYNDFRKNWGYILVKDLKVSVCPYCNRNYIVNVGKSGTTTQLDHFFDKSTYPYLVISLYNLVPSCSTCNQKKSNKDYLNIFYPYLESLDSVANFTLQIQNSNFYRDLDGFAIELETKDKRAKKNIESFELNDLYQNHKDIILELIQKETIYNESYLDELMSYYEGTLFKNREDLLRLITCGYVEESEINKRPLSKLIKDISKELQLI